MHFLNILAAGKCLSRGSPGSSGNPSIRNRSTRRLAIINPTKRVTRRRRSEETAELHHLVTERKGKSGTNSEH